MSKPRAFIHWQETYQHDEAGVIVVGRLVFPVSLLAITYGLVVLATLVACIVLNTVTGDSGWWWSLLWIGGGGIGLALLGLLVSLFVWMGRTFIDANEDYRGR